MYEKHQKDLWFGPKWKSEQCFIYQNKKDKKTKAKGRCPLRETALKKKINGRIIIYIFIYILHDNLLIIKICLILDLINT
jgi:hypothetical protein